MIRARVDRWFEAFRRNGDPLLLAKVFDHAAPELWRVAAHLCRDRHAAEDAVQATFLTAIESKERWDGARPLLPWLLGLLANRVREDRRRAARVPQTERLARPGERDPAELAGDGEFGATFREALSRLAEPYRSTVEAHLVHGQAAHEIAAELGVAAGTMRMRLHRGLDQLRQKLPRGFVAGGAVALRVPAESLLAMREVVLAKVPGGAAVAAGSGHVVVGVIGVLLMNKTMSCMLAMAVAAFSLWIGWPLLVGQSAVPAGVADAVVTTTFRLGPPTAEMPPAAAPTEAVQPEQRTAAPRIEAENRGRLRVVLRNAGDGGQVAGAGMNVLGGLPRPMAVGADNRPISVSADGSRIGSTDAGGVATFELPVGFAQVVLRNLPQSKPWYAEVTAGGETEMVVDLPVAIAVDVSVLDANGRAVAGARILGSTQLDVGLVERELGRTAADGHWRHAFVEASVQLRAVAEGHSASPAVDLRGDEATATLRLGAEPAVLAGTVFAVDGRPIADTGVVIIPESFAAADGKPLVARTDAQGRYECSCVPPGPCLVLAWRELESGHRRFTQVAAEAVAGVRTVVDVRFGRGARFVASLRGAEGAALANQPVALALRQPGVPFEVLANTANHGETDGQGACTIDGVMPGCYELQVPTSLELYRERIELVEGQEYRFEHAFGGASWLELRVVDEAGEPLADWYVALSPRGDGTVHEAKVAGDGLVRFEALATGAYQIEVKQVDGVLASVTREVSTGVRTEVVVPKAAMPTSSVRGILFAGDTIASDRLRVSLIRGALEWGQRPDHVSVKLDPATGAFESPPLVAGTYHLQVQNGRVMGAVRFDIEVPADTKVDLGRIEIGGGSAEILVTHADGSPVRDAFVAVTVKDLQPFAPWPWQKQGRGIELTDLPPATWDVLIWGADMVPVLAKVTTHIGACTTLPVVASAGTPVTVQFVREGDVRHNAGLVTVETAGALLAREVVDLTKPYERGFARGSYRITCETGDGRRGVADVTVDAQPGRRIEVRLAR